jgi:cytochrome c6
MRRAALLFVLLVAAVGAIAAGCGQEQDQTATPETVEGSTPTETTETETETTETETTETETETTETETTETETTETETETATTPAVEGDPVAGKAVFAGASACGSCHTLADAGSSGSIGPNLDEAMPSYELALDRITNGQGAMPSFSSSLSEQQIADVSAYVSSVAGQ